MANFKKLSASALALAMLAGCGSGGTSSASTAGASSDGGYDTSATVNVAIDADLNTMDHHIATDGNSFIMQSMCISGLTELDADGVAQPDLASSWDVSDDGLTYTFHLNEDAVWSNGEPVTADDFVFGWQRLDDPETASEYAFILDTIHVVNAAEVNAGEADVSELGVKAVDDHTFEVDLTLPCDFLLGLMAFPSFFPLNEEFYESCGELYATDLDYLLFCGPYVMSDWEPQNSYTFTKNPDYYLSDETADCAETVVFQYQQDTQTAMLSYESGELDVVKLQGEQVDQYADSEGFTNRLQGYVWYLAIDFDTTNYASNADFSNLNLRKAMSLAIDRETICENVLKDGSIAAEGLVPVDLATGPSGEDFREEAGAILYYDQDEAQEYYDAAVEELGHDVEFELLFEDSEASKAVAEYIQSNFEALGMTVTLNQRPKKERLELQNVQNYQVCLTRWGPDYADPQTYMDLFLSDNEANNNGRYNNSDYDALVNDADAGEDATDSEARWQDYIDAEKILLDEDPGVIPVYQNGGAMMINPNVTGIEFHSAGVDSYRHIKVTA